MASDRERIVRLEAQVEDLREDLRRVFDELDIRSSVLDLVEAEAQARERLAKLEALRRSTRPPKTLEAWVKWFVLALATVLLGAGAAIVKACQ